MQLCAASELVCQAHLTYKSPMSVERRPIPDEPGRKIKALNVTLGCIVMVYWPLCPVITD